MDKPTMRCFQLSKFGQPLVENRSQVPQPEGTEVLIRIAGAGVCHSDVHVCEGYFDLGRGKTLPFGGVRLPLTLGHEAAGTVVAMGEAAEGVTVGESVLVFAWVGCGECAACTAGDEHLCARPQSLGVTRDGAYADYMLVPHARYVSGIGNLDPVAAAPLGCSGLTTYSALKKFGDALRNEPLVIIGAGGLGLMALGLMRMMDAHGAIVIELDSARRQAALDAGALAVIDPRADRATKAVREAAGKPIRMILDLVGNGATIELATNLLNMGGRSIVVGLIGGTAELAVPLLPLKSLSLAGSYLGSLDEFRELIALVRQHGLPHMPIDCRPLESAADALRDLEQGRVVGRVVLVP